MGEGDRERWDRKWRAGEHPYSKEPHDLLLAHRDLLAGPCATGHDHALELACGAGGDAVFLAGLGWRVTAVDVSPAALEMAQAVAKPKGVTLRTVCADLLSYEIAPASYDLITCLSYLDRLLFPRIVGGLRPGGLVIYETYTRDNPKLGGEGPTNPEYLLGPNELLRAFGGPCRVLYYREGPVTDRWGRRADVASILARKV